MTRIGYWRGIGVCGLAVLSFGATAQQQPGGDPAPKWGPHIDLEARPGSERSLGEADFFLPLSQDARTLVFANLRGRFDDNENYEGNLGLGMRGMQPSGWNLGGYGYLDRKRSETGNYFNQVTLGAEALGLDWDFRANAYLPVGTRARDIGSASSAALSGAAIQVTTTALEERALKGFDAEMGWRAPIFGVDEHRQLRLYLGGYRFSDAGVTVEGPRVRAELTMEQLPWFGNRARLYLSAEAQDDDARGSQAFLAVRLRIPLGGAKTPASQLNAQERRMTAPVVRDVDIVTQTRIASTLVETAAATADGQTLTVVDSSTTTTTAALNTALANAGASTVVLSGTFNTNGQVNMVAGQTIIGGGALAVRSPSGRTATVNLPGATIAAGTNTTQYALSMLDNTTLSGITLTNTRTDLTAAYAVTAQSRSNVTIRNSTLSASSGMAGTITVDAMATTNAVISGNTITATSTTGGANGIYAHSANNITIAGNTFESVTTSVSKNVIAGNNFTVFSADSTGNVAISGACFFTGGAPTGSVGFSTISCP
jgi:hypothetical protein